MADKVVKLNPIQRKIAQKMVLSRSEIPHVTTIREVDLSDVLAKREELKNKSGGKLSFMPFIIYCAAAAIAEFEIINATFNPESKEITVKHYRTAVIP